MTRESGFSIVGLVLVLVAVGAFLYWYWSPNLPFDVALPSAAAPNVTTETTAPRTTTSAPLLRTAPTAQPTAAALPVLAPYCPPGQPARFVLGFEQLKARLGDTMGSPLECEHVNADNGDTLQQTTTGLAVYRKQSGALEFTDGWRHWALRGQDLVTWDGDTPPGAPAPESAATAGAADAGVPPDGIRVANTDGAGVALRSEPNEHSRLPSALAEGAQADVLEASDGYVRVRSRDGREGWIPERYVETE
jgi:hypothetical protein